MNLEEVAEWMRRDWNGRAQKDAEHFVYTRDADTDEADFNASGQANYNQLVRPYLPVLLNGTHPGDCRVLEIGCGLGRMTRWFAESFGEVHGVDVSEEMIGRARAALAGRANVTLHTGSGYDLQSLPDTWFDLVFSYIVFQHIPSAAVIGNYLREAERVLKPGGAFKFQLNGDQSAGYQAHVRDTWQGETFSLAETKEMLAGAGLSLESIEDPGTQYFTVTARKGAGPDRRTYYLPGEPEDGGWRRAAARTTMRLWSAGKARLYAAIYFWPMEPQPPHRVTMRANGVALGSREAWRAGDHFLEWSLETEGWVEVEMTIEPADEPALRIVGLRDTAKDCR